MAGSSEDLNQKSTMGLLWHYSRFTSTIVSFKLKDSFDHFVHNALSEIADIIPKKAKDTLSLDELTVILSDFPQVDELFRMPDYRDKLGLRVTTLIRLIEMHGHIAHPEAILDPLELTDKEVGSIRERSGILLLRICDVTEEDLHRYAAGWRKKTEENMREIHAMYCITPKRGAQVTFPKSKIIRDNPQCKK